MSQEATPDLDELRARWVASGRLEDHVAWLRVQLRYGAGPLDPYRGPQVDPVSGVYTRSYARDRLEAGLAAGVPVALILLDLDWFMRLNDQLGILAGDAALACVGRLLPACVRSATDTVGRWAGDTFCLVLLGAGADRAEATAARAVEAVRSEWIRAPGVREPLRVTVSAGIARLGQQDRPAAPVTALVDQAFDGMHAAKDAGRDRWAWGRRQA